ncbi:CD2 antigen cytoplasmic tail-binding protein 2 homolog [Sitophilus oryzae]|uniref:CD2 antigen cytoplasmic tail-binding protein 2 homolog n=1 Tax=Sitophilus oryzae TaxID=7048 RepID=A0A6J2XK96_SITOR|nr:CD2 antigen cytoplasmic tail-binding protein 2 homolog [Sitophilus oryzae]
MSKRKYESQFFETNEKRTYTQGNEKKHTLDSDEEDFIDETNVLDENDIEGEEEGTTRQEGEQRMTAFNMKEELEEGHFDRDGHFIWKNEKDVRDNWLDNIDWHKIKHNAEFANKYDIEEAGLGAESDSDYETDTPFDQILVYKQILEFMKPKETINKALKRLGGDDTKLSSVERLKRKKAGTLKTSEDVTKLTELANQILTRLGNMDIYQETYEQITSKIKVKDGKSKDMVQEPELDMYADDFDVKEKEKLKEPSISDNTETSDNTSENIELQWELKWSAEDSKIEGPYTTNQMIKWQRENYFKPGAVVRKHGENSNFYSLSRIDFELYE